MVQSVKFITKMNKKIAWLKQSKTTCFQLKKAASSIKEVRQGLLKLCMLPDQIPETNLHKPITWRAQQ